VVRERWGTIRSIGDSLNQGRDTSLNYRGGAIVLGGMCRVNAAHRLKTSVTEGGSVAQNQGYRIHRGGDPDPSEPAGVRRHPARAVSAGQDPCREEALDEVVAVAKIHRKAANRLLRRAPRLRPTPAPGGRPREYGPAVATAAEVLWQASGRISAHRLHPFVSELLERLVRCGELRVPPAVEKQLRQASRPTLTRLLAPARAKFPRRGATLTPPGGWLRQEILIRTFTDWDDARPGFCEIDLVAHCGRSEPPRILWGLHSLKGWGHGQTKQVFPRSAGPGRPNGPGAAGQARLPVGGDHLDRGEDRLYGGDFAQLGAAGRAGCGPPPRADDGGTGTAQAARARELRVAAGERDPAEGVGVFRPGGARPPSEVMVGFIDAHRETYGVEPICGGLPIAPALYYELTAREREPAREPTRTRRDASLGEHVGRVWRENREVYGVRKVWKQLQREGHPVARCTVGRLMRQLGLRGAVRGRKFKATTIVRPE
jgi:hypothetical protein